MSTTVAHQIISAAPSPIPMSDVLRALDQIPDAAGIERRAASEYLMGRVLFAGGRRWAAQTGTGSTTRDVGMFASPADARAEVIDRVMGHRDELRDALGASDDAAARRLAAAEWAVDVAVEMPAGESLVTAAAQSPSAALQRCRSELAAAEALVSDLRVARARIIAVWQEQGATLDEIGREVGRTRQTVHQWSQAVIVGT